MYYIVVVVVVVVVVSVLSVGCLKLASDHYIEKQVII